MQVEVAKHAGYCYGVERALKLARRAAHESLRPVYTLGPIIHNPQVVESLIEQGVNPVAHLDEVRDGTVIIRTHGVDPKVIEKAKERGIEVIDATCPFVAKTQQRARSLVEEGRSLVIVGEKNHPEVEALLAHVDGEASIIQDVSETKHLQARKQIGVVVQTTQSLENLQSIVRKLLEISTDLKVYNTICDASNRRQAATRQLAERADLMLVVGGKMSANTTRLAQISRETGTPTYHIETPDEIDSEWLKAVAVVGVTAGASTPDWILNEVVKTCRELAG